MGGGVTPGVGRGGGGGGLPREWGGGGGVTSGVGRGGGGGGGYPGSGERVAHAD